MNRRLIPDPLRPLPATLPGQGLAVQVKIEARQERYSLLTQATQTAGDMLRVPTGRPLPMGTRVDVMLRDQARGSDIKLSAMVAGSQQRQGHHGMDLVLLPPPRLDA